MTNEDTDIVGRLLETGQLHIAAEDPVALLAAIPAGTYSLRPEDYRKVFETFNRTREGTP